MLNIKRFTVRALTALLMLLPLGTPATAGGAPLASSPLGALLAAPLVSPTGQPMNSAVLRGQPLIVQFWNTGCRVCRANDRLLRTWGYEYVDRGLFVVGVLERDTRAHLNAYERDLAIGTVSTVDVGGRLARIYHAQTVPTTLFIDASGHVAKVIHGAVTEQNILDGLKLIL